MRSASWPRRSIAPRSPRKIARTYTDRHGLKDLTRELLGVEISKQQQSSDWGAETLSEAQLAYAASDVLHLHALREKLDAMLKREGREARPRRLRLSARSRPPRPRGIRGDGRFLARLPLRSGDRRLLQGDEPLDAAARQRQHPDELVLGERRALRRALDLDQPARAGDDKIRVGLGVGVLGVVEIDHGFAADDAAGNGRDMILERAVAQDRALTIHCRQSRSATQPPVIAAVRVPPSACRTSQSTMICRSPRRARSTTARSERPIRRWISWVRPESLPRRRSRRVRVERGARQHRIFGRHPALARAAQPRRRLVLERGRAQDMRVAEPDEAGAFGVDCSCMVRRHSGCGLHLCDESL